MEARLQGEDLAGLEQGLKEYASLARRDVYAYRLTKLKDEAAKQQAQSKTEVLSKNLQARFNELQALIDRYLDDDAFTPTPRRWNGSARNGARRPRQNRKRAGQPLRLRLHRLPCRQVRTGLPELGPPSPGTPRNLLLPGPTLLRPNSTAPGPP